MVLNPADWSRYMYDINSTITFELFIRLWSRKSEFNSTTVFILTLHNVVTCTYVIGIELYITSHLSDWTQIMSQASPDHTAVCGHVLHTRGRYFDVRRRLSLSVLQVSILITCSPILNFVPTCGNWENECAYIYRDVWWSGRIRLKLVDVPLISY